MTEAIEKVRKEACACVRCGDCHGRGNIRNYDTDTAVDYDLETCDTCGGSGITETCDRCQLLTELEHEDD